MKDRGLVVTLFLTLLAWPFSAPQAPAQAPATSNPLATNLFVYEMRVVDEEEIVVRKRMTVEEFQPWYTEVHKGYVERANRGEIPGQPQATPDSLHRIAAWAFYYDQLELWEKYLAQAIFEDETLRASISEVKWVGPGEGGGPGGQQVAGQSGLRGAEAVVAANQFKSMDSQVGEFFTFGGGAQGGQQGAKPMSNDEIIKQVDDIYAIYLQQGRELDERVYKVSQDFVNGLVERSTARLAYVNWLDEQKTTVVEAALDWGRLQQGEVVEIDGIRFELFSPTAGLPRDPGRPDSVRIVTDNLSPYDVLNDDGTVRAPAGRR